MPGILGYVDKAAGQRPAGDATGARTFESMARAMLYEPFYTCIRRSCPGLGLTAGWVGSKDEAAAIHPMVHEGRGLWLALSGDAGDSAERAARTMLTAYDRGDNDFPRVAPQPLSGLLIDASRCSSLLFTDRLGVERLFVYEDGECLAFASEAKAILAVCARAREFDLDGVAEFIACGCTVGDRSLFRHVQVVPGGTVLELNAGRRPRRRTYFDRTEWEQLEPLGERAFSDELRESLKRVVHEQVAPAAKVAISLTGGLDSRMIMACLQAPRGTVPCYTFGSMYRDTYDVHVARQVANVCGQPHQTLVLGQDFTGDLPAFLERAVFVSDGYLGVSGAAELYLNELARSVAGVRITGNYGGEVLREFRAFKASAPTRGILSTDMAKRVDQAVVQFGQKAAVRPLSFTLFCQAPAGYGRYAIERSQVAVRSPFLDERLITTAYRTPTILRGDVEPSIEVIAACRPVLLDVATDRGRLGRGGRLRRAARRVVREVTFKAEYLTGHGTPDALAPALRGRPGRWLEGCLRGRHKFQHPRSWARGPLGDFVRDLLTTSELPDHLDRAVVRSLTNAQLSGRGSDWSSMDKLITSALTTQLLLKATAWRVR